MTATATRTRKAPAKSTEPKVDAYEVITEKVIAMLEQGVAPWRKPWDPQRDGGPRSLSTGKNYRGINVFLLEIATMAEGYGSSWWGTYKQIAERGGQVRKGEKGTMITFWKMLPVKDETTGQRKTIPLLRTFTVFNVEQADGEIKLPKAPAPIEHDPIEDCETAVAGYLSGDDAPRYVDGGDAAYYSPMQDLVAMPLLSTFDSVEEYYAAKFHELVHSTGAQRRLNREGIVEGHVFGDVLYSKEELIAEMGSAFLAGQTGIATATLPNSAAYLQSWITVLKGDKKLLVSAAGKAQKAADLILGITYASEAPAAEGHDPAVV